MSLSLCRRQWVFLIFLWSFFLLVVPPSRAQRRIVENVPEGPVHFSVDSISLYDPSTQTSWLVIFYKVANDHLQFLKVDGGYRADFQVVYLVYNRDGRQVTGDVFSNTQWAGTYDQTNSHETFVQGHFEFPLAPGDYEIQVWIEGQHAGEMVRTSRQVSVPSFGDFSLATSGLLLANQICPQGEPAEGYERNGLIIVPSVDHSYSDLLPQLSCYFEIYDQKEAIPLASWYESIFEIINSLDEVVLTDTTRVPRKGQLSYGYRDFQVSLLDEDQYVLHLLVKDSLGKRTAEGKTWFQMRWSALGHVAKDYKEAVEQLRYIATDQEYKELKEVQGEERREAWLKFWEQRDPTPGTPTNEMKTEYYRRIEYANVHFSVVSPGWKSDRGRIYIIHGAPDDIEYHPMEIGMKPYQIWHYYSTNRLFYFIDEDGYGDYKLVAWR